jgi:hypothetical protein
VTVFPVNVEIKKTELNPPRELGLRLADAFPGAMDDLVNTVAMRRLRLGIRHSNACGRPGHAKFVFNFHMAIGDEKASAANLITRVADSRIGGSILLLPNLLKSLVGAQGLEL